MSKVQGPHEALGDGHASEEHPEVSRVDRRTARAPHSRAQSRTAVLGEHRAAPQSVRRRGVATSREATGTDDGPTSPTSLRRGFVRAPISCPLRRRLRPLAMSANPLRSPVSRPSCSNRPSASQIALETRTLSIRGAGLAGIKRTTLASWRAPVSPSRMRFAPVPGAPARRGRSCSGPRRRRVRQRSAW